MDCSEKNAFTIQCADTRNKLPESVVSAPTINSFKNRLDKLWKSIPVLYNCEDAEIPNYKSILLAETYTREDINQEIPRGIMRSLKLSYIIGCIGCIGR